MTVYEVDSCSNEVGWKDAVRLLSSYVTVPLTAEPAAVVAVMTIDEAVTDWSNTTLREAFVAPLFVPDAGEVLSTVGAEAAGGTVW